MAQPTNTFDTYDMSGIKEQLSDIIYNISDMNRVEAQDGRVRESRSSPPGRGARGTEAKRKAPTGRRSIDINNIWRLLVVFQRISMGWFLSGLVVSTCYRICFSFVCVCVCASSGCGGC